MCIDLIGPYKIQSKGQPDLECKCVTMIDPASGWYEIYQYDNKKLITVANIAEQEWFTRYSWPTQVTFGRGREYIGKDFQKMSVQGYAIKKKPITGCPTTYTRSCGPQQCNVHFYVVRFFNCSHFFSKMVVVPG